jgi:hypothetical protein
MRVRSAFVLLVLLSTSGLLWAPVDAAAQPPTWVPEPLPPVADAWMRVRSPNFIVEGDVGEKRLRAVAKRCEDFRTVLGSQLSESVGDVPAPVTVVAFAYARDAARFDAFAFEALGPRDGGPSGPVMVVPLQGPDDRVYAQSYSAYLWMVLSRMKLRLPFWFETGLLGYYSTFAVTDGGRKARIGVPMGTGELRSGRLLPLAELLATERTSPRSAGDQMTGRFAFQSWALVHYLQLGNPARAPQAKAFMKRLKAGEPGLDAFNASFPDTAQLEKELSEYVFRAALSYQELVFDQPLGAGVRYTTSPLSTPEVERIAGCLRPAGDDSKRK